MITDTFDPDSPAIINPRPNADNPTVDACLVTFSHVIEDHVLKHYEWTKIASFWFATGETPIYEIRHRGKRFAFFKTYVGAPACVGSIEDSMAVINTKKYVVFGGAGCLDKAIAHGKVMVPTEAYRDEGTSYHYAPAADYVAVKNADVVAGFLADHSVPFVKGKTWTTDSFYRETVNNFAKRKADGCLSVEMECAAVQAMCDFRGLDFYTFFTSGDLLDAPEWDTRTQDGELAGTQHDASHFAIALELAMAVTR
jgi:uridine phosphorylase